MASLVNFSSLLFLFSARIITLSTCPSFASTLDDNIKVTKVQVNQVCSHTTSPALCVHVLTKDRRTSHASMNGLAGISLDLSSSSFQKTWVLLRGLVRKAPNGPVKQRYQTCLGEYVNAVRALNDAKRALRLGDYRTFYNQAMTAFNEVENCEDEFEVPPVDRTALRGLNGKNALLASINLAMANFLHRVIGVFN